MGVAVRDRVGTLATLTVDVMEKLLGRAEWIVARSVELESDVELIAGSLKQTREDLTGLADLLTEAVPAERERIERQPYHFGHGTQLEFSIPDYQPGSWQRYTIECKPYESVVDELEAKAKARPKVWLHSARGAVLGYAAEFWDLCVPRVSQYLGEDAGQSEGYLGRALSLPRGQKLLLPSDYFPNVHCWRSWARSANDFPKLLNGLVVKEWIKHEGTSTAKGRSRISREEANLRARDALKGPPPRGKKRWTERTLARAIGCSPAQVHSLPAWRAYYEEHGVKKKATAPKAVGLTDAVLANEGREDAELSRLLADQAADYEPSPLVSHARKHRPHRRKL
jgi:hypothetical protein